MLAQRPPFPSGVMDCVLPKDEHYGALFLSGVEAATNPFLLMQNEIGAVLTIGTEMQGLKFDLDQKIIMLHDTHHDPIKKHFDEAIHYIDEQRKTKNVLVHCFVGVSRSATVVIAYLMQIYNYTLSQAMNYLLLRRPLINPNPGFLHQLTQFDQELLRKRLTKLRPNSTVPVKPQSEIVPRQQKQGTSHRALTMNFSPLRRVNQTHNNGRKSLVMTPSSVRQLEEQTKLMTPANHRSSMTQESFRVNFNSTSTAFQDNRVLRQCNQQYHSAKKVDQQSGQKNASIFCRSYANTPQMSQYQVLLKAAGSGLGHSMRGRLPIRVPYQK